MKRILIFSLMLYNVTLAAQTVKKQLPNVPALEAQMVAKTPPMGWNSYNCFGATVREDEVRANAEFMAKNLKQFGWEYIVIDYCWFYPHWLCCISYCWWQKERQKSRGCSPASFRQS